MEIDPVSVYVCVLCAGILAAMGNLFCSFGFHPVNAVILVAIAYASQIFPYPRGASIAFLLLWTVVRTIIHCRRLQRQYMIDIRASRDR